MVLGGSWNPQKRKRDATGAVHLAVSLLPWLWHGALEVCCTLCAAPSSVTDPRLPAACLQAASWHPERGGKVELSLYCCHFVPGIVFVFWMMISILLFQFLCFCIGKSFLIETLRQHVVTGSTTHVFFSPRYNYTLLLVKAVKCCNLCAPLSSLHQHLSAALCFLSLLQNLLCIAHETLTRSPLLSLRFN